MTQKKPTPTEAARQIHAAAARLGWNISVDLVDDILTVTKPIATIDDFNRADCEYFSILGYARMTSPGSTWGTDGVGGVSALKKKMFTMNKSGVDKRILKALEKLAA